MAELNDRSPASRPDGRPAGRLGSGLALVARAGVLAAFTLAALLSVFVSVHCGG